MGSDHPQGAAILDSEGALRRLGGDERLYAEMATIVLEDCWPLYDELRNAVAANDAPAVRARAHALKGLVAGCGGVRSAELAHAVEEDAAAGDLASAPGAVDSMESELKLFEQALRDYCRLPAD